MDRPFSRLELIELDGVILAEDVAAEAKRAEAARVAAVTMERELVTSMSNSIQDDIDDIVMGGLMGATEGWSARTWRESKTAKQMRKERIEAIKRRSALERDGRGYW